MKNLFYFFLAVMPLLSLGDNQKIPYTVDSLYQDPAELLLYSEVALFDSVSKADLIKEVKNWAGVRFVNLKEIIVSETEDQLVLNYISKDFTYRNGVTALDWYIRLVIQFKDGKVKCAFYDDGNVYFYNAAAARATQDREIKLTDFFNKSGDAWKAYKDPMINLRASLIETFGSFKKSVATTLKKDDW